MGTGECKISDGVGEARWDVCKGVKERESRKKMIGGERKRKRCERERGRLEGEGRERERDGGTREKETEGQKRKGNE